MEAAAAAVQDAEGIDFDKLRLDFVLLGKSTEPTELLKKLSSAKWWHSATATMKATALQAAAPKRRRDETHGEEQDELADDDLRHMLGALRQSFLRAAAAERKAIRQVVEGVADGTLQLGPDLLETLNQHRQTADVILETSIELEALLPQLNLDELPAELAMAVGAQDVPVLQHLQQATTFVVEAGAQLLHLIDELKALDEQEREQLASAAAAAPARLTFAVDEGVGARLDHIHAQLLALQDWLDKTLVVPLSGAIGRLEEMIAVSSVVVALQNTLGILLGEAGAALRSAEEEVSARGREFTLARLAQIRESVDDVQSRAEATAVVDSAAAVRRTLRLVSEASQQQTDVLIGMFQLLGQHLSGISRLDTAALEAELRRLLASLTAMPLSADSVDAALAGLRLGTASSDGQQHEQQQQQQPEQHEDEQLQQRPAQEAHEQHEQNLEPPVHPAVVVPSEAAVVEPSLLRDALVRAAAKQQNALSLAASFAQQAPTSPTTTVLEPEEEEECDAREMRARVSDIKEVLGFLETAFKSKRNKKVKNENKKKQKI